MIAQFFLIFSFFLYSFILAPSHCCMLMPSHCCMLMPSHCCMLMPSHCCMLMPSHCCMLIAVCSLPSLVSFFVIALCFFHEDQDECMVNASLCNTTATWCVNTDGSYQCSCRTGYTGDGLTCSGENEVHAA